MSLLVTGTIGIDTVETPSGRADNVLGGSAVYFAYAARLFTQVRLVGAVGDDFPAAFRGLLDIDGIDLTGLETRAGSKTFRWTGRYHDNMNDRDTLETQLNVVEEAPPPVPDSYKDSELVFLANSHPQVQLSFRNAVKSPRLTVLDTMDLWINTTRDELNEALKVSDGLIINDSEARQLAANENLIEASEHLLSLGPRFVVIKKGEHGAMLVTPSGLTVVPAFPARRVKDPTGAGDSFAGGMLGYLDSQESIDDAALRRSLVRGTVAASFTIEAFSLERIKEVTRGELDKRVAEYLSMLKIE